MAKRAGTYARVLICPPAFSLCLSLSLSLSLCLCLCFSVSVSVSVSVSLSVSLSVSVKTPGWPTMALVATGHPTIGGVAFSAYRLPPSPNDFWSPQRELRCTEQFTVLNPLFNRC